MNPFTKKKHVPCKTCRLTRNKEGKIHQPPPPPPVIDVTKI